MTKISGFIICKNEEAKIATALQSLASFCDEIVVVDTGSTDQTKQIAGEYTEKIFDFEWCDDFSAARNFALDKCSGDWIVYLDADDEMKAQDGQFLRRIVDNAAATKNGFHLNYQYAKKKSQLVLRAFRNNLGLKFSMPIHEYLDIPEKMRETFEIHPEITIIHHKDILENRETLERNLKILKKALTADPKNQHLKFFAGREYFSLGRYQEAIDIFEDMAMTRIDNGSLSYNTQLYLAKCYRALKDYRKALDHFSEAHSADPRFSEPLIHQADIYLYQLADAERAKEFYEKSLAVRKPASTFPINPDHYYNYPEAQLQKLTQLEKPIVLICGYYGKLNIGDELMLKMLIERFAPKYRVIVASYNPGVTQKLHRVESVRHHHQYFDQAMGQAELVVIGGGTLFHDQGLDENKNVEYYCGIIDRATNLSKKVEIIGVGVDPIYLKKNRKKIEVSFPKCEQIEVRDQASKESLVQCGVAEKLIKVQEDLVLQMEIDNLPRKAERGKKLIGINLCPPPKGLAQKYMGILETQLLPFIKPKVDECDFVFIPGNESDEQFVRYFQDKIGVAVPCFKASLDHYFEEYFAIMGQCDQIIASRYHMLILAKKLKKELLAISYSPKTDSLVKDLELREL